ncbi:hypothetical protein Emed_004342 [Eimeria media]
MAAAAMAAAAAVTAAAAPMAAAAAAAAMTAAAAITASAESHERHALTGRIHGGHKVVCLFILNKNIIIKLHQSSNYLAELRV